MGSEQSQHQAQEALLDGRRLPHNRNGGAQLVRGHTIAAPERNDQMFTDDIPSPVHPDSRPVSPPISVCSDSELPYISYTDRPIGDSPKHNRNKGATTARNVRANMKPSVTKKATTADTKSHTKSAHNIVVVKAAVKEAGIDRDPDILRLQSIPMFLPVMRGTLSLPANRDPEVLEQLQPIHLRNMCARVQTLFNSNANLVAAEQNRLTSKVKEVNYEIGRLLATTTEKQKLYATYAEHFSKIQSISQQLTRCSTLLAHSIESIETLNAELAVEDRLEPFVWTKNM